MTLKELWQSLPYLRVKNTTILAIVAIWWLLFIPLTYFLSVFDLLEIVNAICMAGSLGFCIGYAKAFWNAIRLPVHVMTTAHLFVTGAFIMHFASMQFFGSLFAWRILGRPEWLINSYPIAFARWEMASGIMIMMATSFSKHGDLSPGAYGKVAVFISGVVFLAASVLALMT
jgi:hypothetical protein